VEGEFSSLIPGECLAKWCWDLEEAIDERLAHLRKL
jgi:hypothetical protein